LVQVWPLGHGALAVQVQRPLVFAGSGLEQALWSMGWQTCAPEQVKPQPPQLAALRLVSMQTPVQQRALIMAPQAAPSGSAVYTQVPVEG
jgi:hypothetical protein